MTQTNTPILNAIPRSLGDFTNVHVRPEDAQLLLLDHCAPNRNLSVRTVRKYAQARKAGLWVDRNGDTIRVDQNDKIVDGQHRLAAVAMSGVGGTFTFVRVDKAACPTIDQGRARTLADVVRMRGFGRASNRIAAAAKWIYRMRNAVKLNNTDPIDHGLLLPIVEELQQRGIDEACLPLMRGRGATRGVCPDGQFLALYSEAQEDHATLAVFADGVFRGVGLGPGDPRFAYRQRMLNARGTGREKGLTSARRFELLVKSYNRWLSGEPTQQLHARPLSSDATYPIPGQQ